MAYSTTEQLRVAAGGATDDSPSSGPLAEISNGENAATLTFAQASADAWIDGVTRRINSAAIPWDVTDAPQIAWLAAAEAIYILRTQKRIAVERDDEAHKDRQATLEAIAAGTIMPSTADTYPVGSTSAPVVRARTSSDVDDQGCPVDNRSTYRGFW